MSKSYVLDLALDEARRLRLEKRAHKEARVVALYRSGETYLNISRRLAMSKEAVRLVVKRECGE